MQWADGSSNVGPPSKTSLRNIQLSFGSIATTAIAIRQPSRIMASMRRLGLFALGLSVLVAGVIAAPQDVTKHSLTESLSLDELDEQLQVQRIPDL